MIKSRYIIAFTLLVIVLFGSMGVTFNKNYTEYLDQTYLTLEQMSHTAAHQYDAIFFDMCMGVERVISVSETTSNMNALQEILDDETKGSYYIRDMSLIYPDNHIVRSGNIPDIDESTLEKYLDFEENQLCAGLIKSRTEDSIFYAVNVFKDVQDNVVLLLVSIDYKLINSMVNPETYELHGGYLYLISKDGYFLYHKNPELMGLNLVDDEDEVKSIVGLKNDAYKVIKRSIGGTAEYDRSKYIEYTANEIDKIGYYKHLKSFRGTSFLAIDFTALRRQQIVLMLRSVIPLMLVLLLALYVLVKYIFMIKFTDYFTEVKNDRAFNIHLHKEQKKGNSSESYLIIKIESVMDGNNKEIRYNDDVFYTLSNQFKSLKESYAQLYRISRVHYLMILNTDNMKDKDNCKILDAMRSEIRVDKENTIFVRGRYSFVGMDLLQELDENDDVVSTIIQYMETHFLNLTETKLSRLVPYSEIVAMRNEQVRDKLILEAALLEKNIELFYQPIVDLNSDVVLNNEIQMRIKTDDGYLLPGPFIKVAEEEALIEKVDRLIIEKTFQYYHKCYMKTRHKLEFSINLSAKSINQGMVDFILEYGEKSLIKRNCITFELTETAKFGDMNSAIKQLERLKSAGYKLAVDDFGTGYSSVDLLSKLQIDYVKIDGTFVRNAFNDERTLKTLNALVYLAKNYETEIVAKFVETDKIIAVLKKLEVEYGQGHYFAEPSIEPLLYYDS